MAAPRFSSTFTVNRNSRSPSNPSGLQTSHSVQVAPTFTSTTSAENSYGNLPNVQFHTRITTYRNGGNNNSSPAAASGSVTLNNFGASSGAAVAPPDLQPDYHHYQPSSFNMPQASPHQSPNNNFQFSDSAFPSHAPLSMRLSMPFRSAFSRGFRSDLLNLDNFDNVFQRFGFDNGFGLGNGRSLFSQDQEDEIEDTFASFDRDPSPPSSVSSHYSSLRRDSDPSHHNLNVHNRNFPSISQRNNDNMAHGELEDTIHHIIHSEAPDQLQQRVKIFIAQDRARGLDANNRQQFPRISARLPHGGSLSFSFSSSSTTMHINDGIESGQVPPHHMLTIEQKKQLKERLLAQKNEFISGPNTSATILSSEPDGNFGGKPPGQNTTGSVAERVMWFEGFPQLQISHQPGRMHRSAAHIALQNWKLANPDVMEFSRPRSVERDIPIIREADTVKPNSNAISITLEVPSKQSVKVSSTGGDALAPSKPGNHALSTAVITPSTPVLTDLPQKPLSNLTPQASATGIEKKQTERIVPTILPSAEPKPVDKKWLKEAREQTPEPKPVSAKESSELKEMVTPMKAASRAEVEKASEKIMKALQFGMKKDEKAKEEVKVITPVEKVKPKLSSPPKPLSPGTAAAPIPPFHYPRGKPVKSDNEYVLMEKVRKSFNGKTELKLDEMKDLMKSLGLPLFWRRPVLLAAIGTGSQKEVVTFEMVWNTWKRITANCYDDASRFVCLLAKPGCHYLLPNDFMPLIQDVVDTHPGLNILKEAPEFHARYINTVIARIFFCVNRSWSGCITIEELRRSNFLQVLATLELEDDINVITEYFSYEHFYVIYCKFWELDRDHDLLIDKTDLARHNDHAISSKMIDRIFSGAVTRGPNQKLGKMSYSEFVWFLIAEEDKRYPRSIEYWFRCMDTDGDGVLSLFELEYFYEEQLQRMKSLGIEALPFEDIACQMLDMVRPQHKDRILLTDLKRCRMTPLFFDTFFNIEKYLLHEHRDPFASSKLDTEDNEPISDWERYAAEEYEMLVSEDAASEDL